MQEAVKAQLLAKKSGTGKPVKTVKAGARKGLAEALGEIRARTQTLSKARFEQPVRDTSSRYRPMPGRAFDHLLL